MWGFVSPPTGGIDEKHCKGKDDAGLAVAMEQAMSNYERLKKVVVGNVAVLDVVALADSWDGQQEDIRAH